MTVSPAGRALMGNNEPAKKGTLGDRGQGIRAQGPTSNPSITRDHLDTPSHQEPAGRTATGTAALMSSHGRACRVGLVNASERSCASSVTDRVRSAGGDRSRRVHAHCRPGPREALVVRRAVAGCLMAQWERCRAVA
jgi:hypothetical protein